MAQWAKVRKNNDKEKKNVASTGKFALATL